MPKGFRVALRRLPIAIVSLIISSVYVPANASTENLLNECRAYLRQGSTVSSIDTAHCVSYIAGFYDGWTTGRLYFNPKTELVKKFDVCFPEGISWNQLIAVFVRWGDKHPEKWHWEQWSAVRAAFKDAWPCKK